MTETESETERIVAVLHDVVEDTDYTIEAIEETFGSMVRAAVDALTKRMGENYTEFIERVAENPIARRVKIADLENNMDLTRLSEVNDSVVENQRKYHDAWVKLNRNKNAY
ncbi:GTP pyrophosphokinase [Haladaptatus sp. ZSTT2]|uniref:GTP pyrophosphokinase n=1 Tax=Haladaptatus sp. ZSTT2 TaxID=3120515 RepID=UPI003FA5EDD6